MKYRIETSYKADKAETHYVGVGPSMIVGNSQFEYAKNKVYTFYAVIFDDNNLIVSVGQSDTEKKAIQDALDKIQENRNE